MAAALNDTLYLKVGSAVGVEGRSISNLRAHDTHIGDGLTCAHLEPTLRAHTPAPATLCTLPVRAIQRMPSCSVLHPLHADWAPNANMERDPRWGRNQEAPGEDPHLTGKYIAAYVRGLQEGEDPDHVQMVATCKHFIANSLEHSTIGGKVITRHNFDAEISLPELTDYYMPGFKACVQEGRALGIMCSCTRPQATLERKRS